MTTPNVIKGFFVAVTGVALCISAGVAASSTQKTPAAEEIIFERSIAAGEGWTGQSFVAVSPAIRTDSGETQRCVTYRVAFTNAATTGTLRLSSCGFINSESDLSLQGVMMLGIPNQPGAKWRITNTIKPTAAKTWASVAGSDDVEVIASCVVED